GHLAIDDVAEGPHFLPAGQGPRVEPEHLPLGRLDRAVLELDRDQVVESPVVQLRLDADAEQVASAVLDRLDPGVDVTDPGAGHENRIPGFLLLSRRGPGQTAEDQSPGEQPEARAATRPTHETDLSEKRGRQCLQIGRRAPWRAGRPRPSKPFFTMV